MIEPTAVTAAGRPGRGPIPNASVSVIVPVYNEAHCVRESLLSLLGQDFRPLEIVVVDDGSRDESARICEATGLTVLRQPHRGLGPTRNVGARKAAWDILVFADADMVYEAGYVSTLVAPIILGEAVATCHWDELVLNWDHRWARCESYYFRRPGRRRQPVTPPEGELMYRAVRKDFFLEAGGFAENEGRGDDLSVARRTGVLARIVRGAVCYHRGPESLREVLREAAWHGRNVCVAPQGRLRRSLAALADRNVPGVLERGVVSAVRHGELGLPVFAVTYALGFSWGVLHALASGRYVK
ncbi:MAG TPA: glycosyltransferase family 2 protein [Methylomirabilota bacterium]|nr:glycosyltransferase family 2 protein [Methylomirabilota bacterium]